MPVRLKMTPCMSMTDTVAIHGIDKDLFLNFRHYEVPAEAVAAFRADRTGALIGRKMAERYNWKVGQRVTLDRLEGFTFNVQGIFSARGTADDFLILVGREYLQQAENEQGVSNHVLVKLRDGVDPAVAAAAIEAQPMTVATTAQPERAMLAAALDSLSDLVAASRIVIAVIVVVMLIAMGNAISMATRDRTHEFGILRTLGFQKRAILALVLSEAGLQALFGALLGCAVVTVLIDADVFKTVSTCGISIHLTAGAAAWQAALASIVVAGLLGALLPAWHAAQLDVVEALRREE